MYSIAKMVFEGVIYVLVVLCHYKLEWHCRIRVRAGLGLGRVDVGIRVPVEGVERKGEERR